MTVSHDKLVRNIMLWNHANDTPSTYDILLNPARKGEMEADIAEIENNLKNNFITMDITDQTANQLVLAVLWFSELPCNLLLVSIKCQVREGCHSFSPKRFSVAAQPARFTSAALLYYFVILF
jgi:hypothetical protein